MREFLTSGQVGNIELNAQKKIREDIQNRWDSLGFTEGLEGNIKENVAIKRITGRRNCPGCGEIYNIFYKKPCRDGICDKCNSTLAQRKDDNVETAISRFNTYKTQTAPLINYYTKTNKLVAINVGEEGVADIFTKVCKLIENK